MKHFLSEIAGIFQSRDRGCIVMPGVTPPFVNTHTVNPGDALEIILPDGKVINTRVYGVSLAQVRGVEEAHILLPPEVTRDMIAIGSKLYNILNAKKLGEAA